MEPIDVVATTEPSALVESSEYVIPVIARLVLVAPVAVIFWNAFVPEKVLLSPSNVELAKLQVDVAKVYRLPLASAASAPLV